MANEKVGLSVPEGSRALVKAIAASIPVEWTESQIWTLALLEWSNNLIEADHLGPEEKALIKARIRPVEEALIAANTDFFEIIRSRSTKTQE